MNGATGGFVVGSDDSGKFAVRFSESRDSRVIALFFRPLPAPGFVGNGDPVGFFRLLKRELLALFKLVGVVVRGRTLQQKEIAAGGNRQHRRSLQFSDLDIVEGNVERDRAILDQPVITHHRHSLALGRLHNRRGFLGIVRHYDQDIRA